MVESQSNLFHPRKRLSFLHSFVEPLMPSFSLLQNPFAMLHDKPKPCCSPTIFSSKMGSVAPLAVGTRGTIGSLVRREIEYFKRVDLERTPNGPLRHQDPKPFTTNPLPCSNNTSLGNLLMMSWKKKKKKKRRSNNNGGSFLPSMCSAVDVSEGKKFDGIPGFSYRTVKADMENL